MRRKLLLPYPPSLNRYWRRVGAKTLISAGGREYRASVVSDLAGTAPMSGRLAVEIEVYQPDRRRRDLDNLPKALLDALAHAGVYDDDSQIDDLRIIRMGVDRDRPRVEVTISDITGSPDVAQCVDIDTLLTALRDIASRFDDDDSHCRSHNPLTCDVVVCVAKRALTEALE